MAEAAAVVAAASAAVGAAAGMVGSVSQAKPALWDPLMRTFASSNSVKEILDALKEAVGVLRSKRKDYQNEVEGHKMKVPSETYKEWLRRVMEIEDQVDNSVAKHDKESEKSSFSFSTSSTFREDLVKKHEQVIKLLEESDQIRDKLLIDQPPEPVVKMRAPDIKKFETLQKSLEQVLGLLRNDKVKGIQIHGTVGIGKTTIMLNLNNHDEVAKMFDIVIWVKVSTEESKENLSREHLQQAVLRRLKLNIKGTKRADEVAHEILEELKGKKYLLLMDDVKQDLNLYKIGIPNGKNGSKIVLTSRLGHVCSSLVNRVIKVTNLSADEAWEMFQDVLECPKIIENPKIGPLAWRVCNDCGGLPLLIEKVANTFKVKNSECLWSDGLNSWRMWPQKECQGIREMYNMLKFCYNDLDDAQKKCFIYGALYPEDSDIYTDYLLECWAAEDFLGNDHHAKNMKARNGHFILSHLKNVSLLEETMSEKCITMHKFIRQVALYIASDDPKCKYLVKPNGALQEASDEESWSQKNRISLSDNEFHKLPDCPDCSMLSTLFLQKNSELATVPESFFDHMPNLRVLNFCQTGIMSLPISVSKLIGLKVLYLCDCEYLMELPSAVGELPHLEVLDIRRSGIHNIPTHIKNLKGLRCLRISFTKSGNVNGTPEMDLNHDIISKLSALEELVIDMKTFDQWSNKVLIENIIKEVAILKRLTILKLCFADEVVDVIEVATTFRIHVPDAGILQTFMKNSHLWRNVIHIKSFQLLISCKHPEHPQIPEYFKYARYIKYCNGEGASPPFPEVFAKAEAIELVNHKDIKQLSDFGIASMTQIRGCLIESCNEIETIISRVDCKIILNLEHLYMKNLPKLESIWKVPMQSGSLTKLKTLVLSSCQMLKKIFPPGVVHQLEMQYLKIEDCPGIVEIFEESETSGHPHVLPKLKKFVLIDMPKLESICTNELLNWPSLENLEICKCPSLLNLLFITDNAPKLKHFKLE
ncbi:unnamed protein product [Camellia sinensis]